MRSARSSDAAALESRPASTSARAESMRPATATLLERGGCAGAGGGDGGGGTGTASAPGAGAGGVAGGGGVAQPARKAAKTKKRLLDPLKAFLPGLFQQLLNLAAVLTVAFGSLRQGGNDHSLGRAMQNGNEGDLLVAESSRPRRPGQREIMRLPIELAPFAESGNLSRIDGTVR